MTVQTIHVPVLVMPRDRGVTASARPLDAGPAVPNDGTCMHVGRCDRDACGQAERRVRHCPSEGSPASAL